MTHEVAGRTLTTNLTITAAGSGPVVLQGSGLKKGMFVSGSSATTPNVTIRGLTFENARSPSGNGAGVRYQSGNLTLINDTFRNNQDGVLATPFIKDTGTIVVQGSTFDHNGIASGLGHNLYIDRIADFVMKDSVSEHAVVGARDKVSRFQQRYRKQSYRGWPHRNIQLQHRSPERRQRDHPGQRDRAGTSQ